MKRALVACFALSTLAACSSLTQERVASQSIEYEMKTFQRTSSPECDSISECARYEVSYPSFTGVDASVSSSIQRLIEASFALGDPDAATKSMAEIAEGFVADYEEFTKEVPDLGQPWFYHGEAVVNVLVDTLISIGIDEEYYTGGAHGGAGRYFLNIDPRTGNQYALDDFFQSGFRNALNDEAENAFRIERELADTATYQFNYFEFPDNRFSLNENFGWTPDGLIFYYNNYEIAPYAAGPTEIVIPMNKLKSWLKNSKPAL